MTSLLRPTNTVDLGNTIVFGAPHHHEFKVSDNRLQFNYISEV